MLDNSEFPDGGGGGKRRRTIIIWSVIAGIVVLALLVFVGSYSGLLGARFAPGLPFQITGPDQLIAGQPAIVTWDTSPENQAQYPSEKIEFCRGRLFGESCVTLNLDTTNDGEALVFVPRISPGSGYLRLTARNRPGGDLLPRASMTKSIQVVAGAATGSTIGPRNVGGGSIGTLSAVGPRIGVARQGVYTVILPEPSLTKKIEICQHGGRCYALASSVKGASAEVRVPNVPVGRAYLKISERGSGGHLTGREFYRRALLITPARAQQSAQADEDGGDDGSGEGDSGGGGDSSSNSEASESIREESTAAPRAAFIVPVDEEQVNSGSDVDARVQLTEATLSGLVCQQWKLNGEILTVSDWVGGQSPDLSAEPCN